MTVTEKAFSKLNISLDVLSLLDNGYHSMLMVLQTADLCDDITIDIERGDEIRVNTDLRYIPSDQRNIAWKAADLFLKETGISGYSISIDIKKKIPVCAGLGGGSADAAAVLRALNRAFGSGLDRNGLELIGGKLGSDVPFCIAGGTSLAEGRGDILTDLKPLPECFILICKPRFSISTPELFKLIDCKKIVCRPDTQGILKAISDSSLPDVCRRMYNVFEPVLPRGASKINSIKQIMLDNDALGAVMTGTGSAVFGIFDNQEALQNAFDRLSSGYGHCEYSRPVKRIEF